MEAKLKEDMVCLYKDEYDDMLDYMERLKETIDFLSDKEAVKRMQDALSRIESGEYLTKEDMIFD